MPTMDPEQAVNLDAMTPSDLWEFWRTHKNGQGFRVLFPDGGKLSKTATKDLANYASNKAVAMDCRLRGDIETALMYEGICDRIYQDLPSFARSW